MVSRTLLLVLLGLSCLQAFTAANNANGASECCFEFHKDPIPVGIIASYKETRYDCTHSGVVLTTKRGFRFCADPADEWVQQAMKSKTSS